MKENFEKFKYLIAGSVLTCEKSGYKSYVFDVPKILHISFTIYDNGEDFIYVRSDLFGCSYWFTEVKIEDKEEGSYICFYNTRDGKSIFVGSLKLENIYLEVEK